MSQSYRAHKDHFDEENKTGILLSDYDDAGLAGVHLAAVKEDTYASVIHLANEKHLAKLAEMLSPASQYTLYWAVVKDPQALKKRVDVNYKDQIRRYISKNTTWRIAGSETFRPQLQVIFGILFVTLKHGSQQIRIKFEDLEKA
ncbi:MAG: hypothetical protein ABIP80_00820 [Ferruginibacter sp.]